MDQSRREIIKWAGASAAAAISTGSLIPRKVTASREQSPRPTLVAIYLRGGADALSTVVPYSDKHYSLHRPSLALAPPGSGSNAVLPLSDEFGFNPIMKQLHALYERGMCIPIVSVGSHHPTRSHFDAQDFMERGAPGIKHVTTGWLNRYLEATRTSGDAKLRALSMQPLLPRSLRGDYPVLAKPEQKADHAMEFYSRMYIPAGPVRSAGHAGRSGGLQTKQAIEAAGAQTIEQLWELTQILEHPAPVAAEYPPTKFGGQMRDIAKVIKFQCGLEVTAIDYGGWDHHINVGPIEGQLGTRLADVSEAIGAFVEDLGPELMRETLIVVMSEFGRAVKENDNQGTDHGHGGIMLLVGGKLNGRRVYGQWTGLDESKLYQRRDLPVHTDFRQVFAELLNGVFKFDGLERELFEGYKPPRERLGFMA